MVWGDLSSTSFDLRTRNTFLTGSFLSFYPYIQLDRQIQEEIQGYTHGLMYKYCMLDGWTDVVLRAGLCQMISLLRNTFFLSVYKYDDPYQSLPTRISLLQILSLKGCLLPTLPWEPPDGEGVNKQRCHGQVMDRARIRFNQGKVKLVSEVNTRTTTSYRLSTLLQFSRKL